MPRTWTRHALAMLEERGIEREWVERLLDRPDLLERDPSDPTVFRAYGAVPERGGRVLRVVVAAEGGAERVVTAFFDRGRGEPRRGPDP